MALFWIIAGAVTVTLFAVAWVMSGPRFSRAALTRRRPSQTEQDALIQTQASRNQYNSTGGFLS